MRIFGEDKYSGRRKSKNSYSKRSDRRDSVTMHDAVCDECGKSCQVPFKPSGDKPIYCNDCFDKQGGRDRRDNRGGAGMFTAICDDCGDECRIPFKPSSDKPIYCSRCFEKRGNTHDSGRSRGGNNNAQLDEINEKLDRILEILDK